MGRVAILDHELEAVCWEWQSNTLEVWAPDDGGAAIPNLDNLPKLFPEKTEASFLFKSLVFGVFHSTQPNLILTTNINEGKKDKNIQ